jgi:hypothetical protein
MIKHEKQILEAAVYNKGEKIIFKRQFISFGLTLYLDL